MNEDEKIPEAEPAQEISETEDGIESEGETPEEISDEARDPSLPDASPVEKTGEDEIAHLTNKVNALQRLLDKDKKGKKEAPTRLASRAERAGEFVTREELYKREEKQAVRNVTTSAESDVPELKAQKAEIKENWDSIMGHFRVDDRSDADAIEEGIYDAYAVWKRRGGVSKTSNTAINAELSTSTGKGGTSPRATPSAEKTFFPKPQPFDEWFPAVAK